MNQELSSSSDTLGNIHLVSDRKIAIEDGGTTKAVKTAEAIEDEVLKEKLDENSIVLAQVLEMAEAWAKGGYYYLSP